MIHIRTVQYVLSEDENSTEDFDDEIKELPISGGPSPNNLAVHRWHGPPLEPAAEAELIRLAQTGDKRAGAKLLESFHGLILKIAGTRISADWRSPRLPPAWIHTDELLFQDLVAAGCLALWEATLKFDLSHGTRFSTYAFGDYAEGRKQRKSRKRKDKPWLGRVGSAISDTAKKWRKGAPETRIDRWLYSHPNATPEELLAAQQTLVKQPIYHSFEEAAEAIRLFKAWGPANGYLTTTESDYSDDDKRSDGDDFKGSRLAACVELRDLYDFFSRCSLSPHLGFHDRRVSPLIDWLAADHKPRSEITARAPSKPTVKPTGWVWPNLVKPDTLWCDDWTWIRWSAWQGQKNNAAIAAAPQKETDSYEQQIGKRGLAPSRVRGTGVGRGSNGARSPARPHDAELHLQARARQRPAGTRIASREGGLK